MESLERSREDITKAKMLSGAIRRNLAPLSTLGLAEQSEVWRQDKETPEFRGCVLFGTLEHTEEMAARCVQAEGEPLDTVPSFPEAEAWHRRG